MDRLKKKPENQEALDVLIRKERRLRTLEDEIPLEYIIEGVKITYRERDCSHDFSRGLPRG